MIHSKMASRVLIKKGMASEGIDTEDTIKRMTSDQQPPVTIDQEEEQELTQVGLRMEATIKADIPVTLGSS